MSKSRKSLSPWVCCDKCQSSIMQKDLPVHDSSCPPSSEKWNHSCIRHGVLYSTLEIYASQVLPQNISEYESDNMIFMAQSAMQLCDISIGDPVLIASAKENAMVKIAWPMEDKTLTSVSMTRKAMEASKTEGQVRVKRLPTEPYIAREIVIEYIGKRQSMPKVTPELQVMIQNRNERRIFCIGNRISVLYYGKNLSFKIVRITDDDNHIDSKSNEKCLAGRLKEICISEESLNNKKDRAYKALYSTKWCIVSNESGKSLTNIEAKMTTNDIGGYETIISDLRDVLDVALGKWRKIKGFNVPKGILLYGTTGVGKSTIASAVLSEYSVNILAIKSFDFQRKIIGETESRLSRILDEAKNGAPQVIFIRDIDQLCPRNIISNVDSDKRNGYAIITKLFDDIRRLDGNIVVLATTSRPDFIESSLRRPGRLDKELEVCAPTPRMRREILHTFLNKVTHRLSDEDVDVIASTTHGFVGADLYGLCSDSALRAMKRYHLRHSHPSQELEDITIDLTDFNDALKNAKPTAMKEVVVEVPNVKWTDIGGQKKLKLQLKQAVEWPLKHPEAFTRLGITPPRGLLMFGPPGCSKTMVAKALATETKLNFLNIKGPELFSKWVGESERAVRQVFRKARQVAPSIIFIDEIDALGSERASSSNGNGGSNVQERVLAQLLTELDGVTELGNVTLVAATNRPDRIDKALLRPGRLDRIVYVPLPDAETRHEILSIKLGKMPHAQDVNIQDLVDLTEGYSGAEVQAICHEAAMKALEEDLSANIITKEHFEAALSIVTPRTSPDLLKVYEQYMNNNK